MLWVFDEDVGEGVFDFFAEDVGEADVGRLVAADELLDEGAVVLEAPGAVEPEAAVESAPEPEEHPVTRTAQTAEALTTCTSRREAGTDRR